MKIFASNQFTPVKSLKKAAKIAAVTLPLMAGAESCGSWLCFPPPPPRPHYIPRPHIHMYPYPHYCPHTPFGIFSETQPQDSIQSGDVLELGKKDIAYLDNAEQK